MRDHPAGKKTFHPQTGWFCIGDNPRNPWRKPGCQSTKQACFDGKKCRNIVMFSDFET
jgi:hypothetical protein